MRRLRSGAASPLHATSQVRQLSRSGRIFDGSQGTGAHRITINTSPGKSAMHAGGAAAPTAAGAPAPSPAKAAANQENREVEELRWAYILHPTP